jgi:transcriptional regulator with PAS, ATPase and Fis domain
MNAQRAATNRIIDTGRRSRHQRQVNEEEPLFETNTSSMVALVERLRRAAAGDATILLTGESGTGKDVLAREIHKSSPRSAGPLVRISCATLSESLLENELFGHIRGAFSGAVSDKPGQLEAAHGGTIVFNEIAELPPTLQTKLLRFIEEHRFERIGSNATITVNVSSCCRDESQLADRSCGWPVSRGSLLSAQRDHVLASAAARTQCRYYRPGRLDA